MLNLFIVTIGILAWYAIAISVNVPEPPLIAIITSHDCINVNSLPPPISEPQGINIVGLNSPYIFLLLPPVIPTVIPLLADADFAASVEREV